MRSLLFILISLVARAGVSNATTVQGFTYAGDGDDGQGKIESDFQNQFTIAKALAGTSNAFTSARIYTNIQGGTTSSVIQAIPAAIAVGTSLLLGVGASAGQDAINNEITALQSAITLYDTSFSKLVIGLSVGSKDLYRNSAAGFAAGGVAGADPDVLVSYINQIRAALKGTVLANVLIGHTDKLPSWVNSSNSALIDAVDWLGIDLQPFLDSTNTNSINNATASFQDEYDAVVAVSKGKPVWVTETGWPTSGTQGEGVGSANNVKQYWDDIGCALFGKTNTWWYNLFADVTSSPDWGVVYTNSTTLYDLSCNGVTPNLILSTPSSAKPTATGSSITGSSSPTGTGAQQSSSSTATPGTPGSTSGKQKSSRLSSGAIAGVAIAGLAVLAVLALLTFLAFVCLRRRRASRHGASEPSAESGARGARGSVEPGRGAELPTKANTHEAPESSKPGVDVTAVPYDNEKHGLQAQDNKHELPENGTADTVAAAALPHEDTSELPTQFNKHELERPTEPSSATYSPTTPGAVDSYGSISPDQFELASDPIIPELAAEPLKRKPLPSQSPILRLSSLSNTNRDSVAESSVSSGTGRAANPESADGPRLSRLDILQQRMERIRAEKERLAKERELEEMEAALQQEIMAELRKEHGA
ncbi:glycoside hydrolase family 17 protein [Stipitochalara longipes BDJ]|nr:glycoside hydrolase family 17 protein [Stipitochalara longipes BDJ]